MEVMSAFWNCQYNLKRLCINYSVVVENRSMVSWARSGGNSRLQRAQGNFSSNRNALDLDSGGVSGVSVSVKIHGTVHSK